MPDGPLVSVVIPVWNRATLLREAVDSVLTQSHSPIEIVIVDDGSTDHTAEVAESISRQHKEVEVLRQANGGPGSARETGRLRAGGEFIQYLDSDDLLLPRKFEIQVAGLMEHPECGASYGWTRLRMSNGSSEEAPFKRTGERIAAMFPAFLQSRWWDTSTPLFRRSVVDAAGPWQALRMEEDWEYDARVAALGTRLHYCEAWVSETRQLDPQRTSLRQGPEVLRDRARAHSLIYEHARRAGIADDTPEMNHFSRELFLLARQCGAAGLIAESETLFELARKAAGKGHDRYQFRVYGAFARSFGWRAAGRVAALSDRMRW